MNPDDKALAIATRIADGSAIDWPVDECPATADERALLEELKTIAAMATLHRTPLDWPTDAGSPGGTQWGALLITSKIGEGRFGQVFAAWDARLQRRVALKLLHAASPVVSGSPAHAIEEARLLARVRHSNVLTVHGAESFDGQVGIWTEFIEGRTLEALLAEQGPMTSEDVIGIGLDLCRALAAVHGAGLLHRDIKAQNVMRETGGRIVLMDFGTGHDLTMLPTSAGDLSGTPLYLAPEIFAGGRGTVASDLYALAVLLFHLLTGQYPVPGRTLDDVRTGHRDGGASQLRDLRGDLSVGLIDAIDRGLSPDPSQRYETAAGFEAALEQARGLKEATTPTRMPTRRRAVTLAWALAVATVLIGVWMLGLGSLRDRLRAPLQQASQPSREAAPYVSLAPEVPVAGPIRMSSSPTGPTAVERKVSPTVRQIRLPQHPMGRPSRDGRYMPYVDARGDLRIWETATGLSRRVIERNSSGESILTPIMSPTGDRVAYGLSTGDGGWELRMVQADGTWPSVLIERETAYTPVPLDWSRDGQNILCRLNQRDKSTDLVLISSGGGTPRVFQTFQNGAPANLSLSPDGRFVVYYGRPDPASRQRSLLIIGTDGSAPRVLVEAAPTDGSPLWTPDGRHVFFTRPSPKVYGSLDAWILPVADGVAVSDPSVLASNLGVTYGLALTDSGALFDEYQTNSADVYTLSIDLKEAAAHGAPTRISPTSIGGHVGPSWSPDGQWIAYLVTHERIRGGTPSRTLAIRDVRTGSERLLHPQLTFTGGYSPAWLPDGQSVIIYGGDLEKQSFGFFRVDVRTSETSLVMLLTGAANSPTAAYFQCSTNGRDFVYVDARGIVARDLGSGSERVLVARDKRFSIGPFGFSRDGQTVAFTSLIGRDGAEASAVEVQTVGGSPLELVRLKPPASLRFQAWTPDGHELLYATWADEDPAAARLWRIQVSGGEPRDMNFPIISAVINPIKLSPDGRHLAYTERDASWMLSVTEHLLSALQIKKLQ